MKKYNEWIERRKKVKRTLELLEIEKKCILRNENNECDRNCANCDLVQKTGDLLEAYDIAISDLKEKYRLN